MKFLVKNIYEDDFGCEERPVGYETMCILQLQDENGEGTQVRVKDATLTAKNINEGDWVYFDDQSQIHKDKEV